jgi:hypothetical protein
MPNGVVETAPRPRNIGRSVLALLAGFLVAVVLSLVTDLLLHQFGFYPPLGEASTSSQMVVATLYRAIFGILSAWVTARLAPYNPLGHALIGGAIGTVIALVGAIGTWDLNLGPHWYSIALVVLSLPESWIGGKIRVMQLS